MHEALGRVLAEDFVALESLPRFHKSAMDGYALKATDTASASESKPATLELTQSQEITAGQAKPIGLENLFPPVRTLWL